MERRGGKWKTDNKNRRENEKENTKNRRNEKCDLIST